MLFVKGRFALSSRLQKYLRDMTHSTRNIAQTTKSSLHYVRNKIWTGNRGCIFFWLQAEKENPLWKKFAISSGKCGMREECTKNAKKQTHFSGTKYKKSFQLMVGKPEAMGWSTVSKLSCLFVLFCSFQVDFEEPAVCCKIPSGWQEQEQNADSKFVRHIFTFCWWKQTERPVLLNLGVGVYNELM